MVIIIIIVIIIISISIIIISSSSSSSSIIVIIIICISFTNPYDSREFSAAGEAMSLAFRLTVLAVQRNVFGIVKRR